jgi:hypothetical protein
MNDTATFSITRCRMDSELIGIRDVAGSCIGLEAECTEDFFFVK